MDYLTTHTSWWKMIQFFIFVWNGKASQNRFIIVQDFLFSVNQSIKMQSNQSCNCSYYLHRNGIIYGKLTLTTTLCIKHQSINYVLYIWLLTVSDHLQNSMLVSRRLRTENIVATLKFMTTWTTFIIQTVPIIQSHSTPIFLSNSA